MNGVRRTGQQAASRRHVKQTIAKLTHDFESTDARDGQGRTPARAGSGTLRAPFPACRNLDLEGKSCSQRLAVDSIVVLLSPRPTMRSLYSLST